MYQQEVLTISINRQEMIMKKSERVEMKFRRGDNGGEIRKSERTKVKVSIDLKEQRMYQIAFNQISEAVSAFYA